MSSTPVLSPRQMRRIENLPEDYKVVNTRDGVVILRRADGQLLRMQPDGRLAPNLSVERVQDYLRVQG
ncbi:MAG TPA: hypothetical protein VNZ01_08650 [Solirubrobacteraceae bacterium]|nr:hypothetical protein [Solirubrobacteraceae bacterium]